MGQYSKSITTEATGETKGETKDASLCPYNTPRSVGMESKDVVPAAILALVRELRDDTISYNQLHGAAWRMVHRAKREAAHSTNYVATPLGEFDIEKIKEELLGWHAAETRKAQLAVGEWHSPGHTAYTTISPQHSDAPRAIVGLAGQTVVARLQQEARRLLSAPSVNVGRLVSHNTRARKRLRTQTPDLPAAPLPCLLPPSPAMAVVATPAVPQGHAIADLLVERTALQQRLSLVEE